jgi:hypothetical protein
MKPRPLNETNKLAIAELMVAMNNAVHYSRRLLAFAKLKPKGFPAGIKPTGVYKEFAAAINDYQTALKSQADALPDVLKLFRRYSLDASAIYRFAQQVNLAYSGETLETLRDAVAAMENMRLHGWPDGEVPPVNDPLADDILEAMHGHGALSGRGVANVVNDYRKRSNKHSLGRNTIAAKLSRLASDRIIVSVPAGKRQKFSLP